MHRGQMEIFGLMIIVILVSVGLLFAVTVITKKPAGEERKVRESVQAANFLNTALATNVPECGNRAARQLLQDCALAGVENGRWIGAGECSDGVNTCQKIKDVFSLFLRETFDAWEKNYVLFIENSAAVEQIRFARGDCSGEREGSSRPEIVRPVFSVLVTLHLCS